MKHEQHIRTECLDCASPMFIVDSAAVTRTRCERCLRKYAQQVYLLREFLERSRSAEG